MRYLSLLASVVGLLQFNLAYAQPGCINPDQIDPNAICLGIWAPVCGCDNMTYANDCNAFNSGVTSWTEGECSMVLMEPCTDLAGVDFGPCFMVMGFGVIENNCMSIGGCGPLVGNLDYSSAIYSTMEACQACISTPAEPCTDLAGVDFGSCDMLMGFGIVNSTCVFISGCGPVVNNVDYSSSIYQTTEACQACITGINDDERENRVFPNPTNEGINIQIADGQNHQGAFRLCALTGQDVLSGVVTIASGFGRINVSNLETGVYFLTLEFTNGVSAHQKILIGQ